VKQEVMHIFAILPLNRLTYLLDDKVSMWYICINTKVEHTRKCSGPLFFTFLILKMRHYLILEAPQKIMVAWKQEFKNTFSGFSLGHESLPENLSLIPG